MLASLAGGGAQSPEMIIGSLAVVVLVCFGIWRFVHWLMDGPPGPDPWDQQVAEELRQDDATPLCHRCLTPHDQRTDFCPQCGAPVGDYTNWLPYPYLFSVGHTLRIGTTGEYRHSPLTVSGFFLLAVAEYTLFAPIYWFVVLRGLRRPLPPPMPDQGASPDATNKD
jgi:hypothetical protein